MELLLYPLLYPFGLLRLWLISRGNRPFRLIVRDEKFDTVASQGHIFLIEAVAGIGALAMILLVILVIIGIIRNGFS